MGTRVNKCNSCWGAMYSSGMRNICNSINAGESVELICRRVWNFKVVGRKVIPSTESMQVLETPINVVQLASKYSKKKLRMMSRHEKYCRNCVVSLLMKANLPFGVLGCSGILKA
jgi:hypothetical protein